MARIASSGRGIFLWVDLPEGMDTIGYLTLFFIENIAYIPGRFFYTVSKEKIAQYIPILGSKINQYLEK